MKKTWAILRLVYCAIGGLIVGAMHSVSMVELIIATVLIVTSVIWGSLENKGGKVESVVLKLVVLIAAIMVMNAGFLGIFHNWISIAGILLLLIPFAYRIFYAK